MAAVEEVNSTLVSKCMDFCQALASQGQAFNFSIVIGPNFSFSLDTRSKVMQEAGTKKRASPSTLRRNAKRREEFAKKKNSSVRTTIEDETATSSSLECDQCDATFKTRNGLKIQWAEFYGAFFYLLYSTSRAISTIEQREQYCSVDVMIIGVIEKKLVILA